MKVSGARQASPNAIRDWVEFVAKAGQAAAFQTDLAEVDVVVFWCVTLVARCGGLRAMRWEWRRIIIFAIFVGVLCGARASCAQSKAGRAGDAVSLNNQGLERYKKGKVDEAIALFRQALELNPNFPEALSNLGLALDSQGEGRGSDCGFR